MSDDDIVPCPVCGSKDIKKIYESGFAGVPIHEVCKNCGVMLSLNRKLLRTHCLIENSDTIRAKIRELEEFLKTFPQGDIQPGERDRRTPNREDVLALISKLREELKQ